MNKGSDHFYTFLRTGIERNIRGNSPAVIRREIKPEAVEVPRKKEEGSKPLHKRDEFRTREELVEKRIIKVYKAFIKWNIWIQPRYISRLD